jgi:hypothetical protein
MPPLCKFCAVRGVCGGLVFRFRLARGAPGIPGARKRGKPVGAPGIAAESPQDLHKQIRGLAAESPVFGPP